MPKVTKPVKIKVKLEDVDYEELDRLRDAMVNAAHWSKAENAKLAKAFAALAKGDVTQLMRDANKDGLAARSSAVERVYKTFNQLVDKAKTLSGPAAAPGKKRVRTKADLVADDVELAQGDVVAHGCFKGSKRVARAKFCHNCKSAGGDNVQWTFEVIDKPTKIVLGEVTVKYEIKSKFPNETGQSKAINKLAQTAIKKLKVADLLK